MKALTIKEPWATLIIEGYKEYEFRSWKINYRGKILIHAGMSNEKKYTEMFKDYHLDYPHGAIIGEAILVDCIPVTPELEEILYQKNPLVYHKSEHKRVYAWKLEKIIKYEKPINCKGKLGLWNYDE